MLRRIKRLFDREPPQQVEIKEHAPGDLTIKAGGEEIRVTLPYPDWDNLKAPERAPITLASPACPYCGVIQDPPPQRRRKCRDCGETIHPWTDQETRKKHLLTAAQNEQRIREARDAKWASLNGQVIDGLRTGEWHSVMVAHTEQARMLFHRGGDHRELAAEARKSELTYYLNHSAYQDSGVTSVRIWTVGEESCLDCQQLEGREFTIEEALELAPIPCQTCQTQAEENPHGGWCRCRYRPIKNKEN